MKIYFSNLRCLREWNVLWPLLLRTSGPVVKLGPALFPSQVAHDGPVTLAGVVVQIVSSRGRGETNGEVGVVQVDLKRYTHAAEVMVDPEVRVEEALGHDLDRIRTACLQDMMDNSQFLQDRQVGIWWTK